MGRRPLSPADRRQRRQFGGLLRERRDYLHRGLREAAQKAGLNHTTLSRIESGERPAGLQDLPGLEKAYEVPLEVLQVARSSQTPSSLMRYLFESQEMEERRTVRLDARITPWEKREITTFLGYLRFRQPA